MYVTTKSQISKFQTRSRILPGSPGTINKF